MTTDNTRSATTPPHATYERQQQQRPVIRRQVLRLHVSLHGSFYYYSYIPSPLLPCRRLLRLPSNRRNCGTCVWIRKRFVYRSNNHKKKNCCSITKKNRGIGYFSRSRNGLIPFIVSQSNRSHPTFLPVVSFVWVPMEHRNTEHSWYDTLC